MNTKIKWLREKIKMRNMQAIIISNPYNIKYLTGIDAEGVLIIARKENFFLTDSRYLEEAKSTLTIDDEIIVIDISKISQEDYETFFIFCENVGFEENYITYAQYKDYMQKYKVHNFEETDYIIERQRMIKDEEEIAKIEKACEITDKCFSYLLNYIKIGKTEKEIAEKIEEFFIDNGADELAFETIVASGENSSKPHAKISDRKIELGDPIIIDMGCKYKGYCSDMTRTFFYKNVTQHQQEVYHMVLKANEEAEKAVTPGIPLSSLDQIARGIITDKGYGSAFTHRLGHLIGLEDHEFGDVSSASADRAVPGNIFSIEPGIYLENDTGVRVEDLVLVTDHGHEILNHFSKELTVID